MAEYTTGSTPVLQPGVYQVTYNSAGGLGTGQMEISKTDGALYQIMTDGNFTTSEDRVAYLGGGMYRFTLTGDARIWLDKIPT